MKKEDEAKGRQYKRRWQCAQKNTNTATDSERDGQTRNNKKKSEQNKNNEKKKPAKRQEGLNQKEDDRKEMNKNEDDTKCMTSACKTSTPSRTASGADSKQRGALR